MKPFPKSFLKPARLALPALALASLAAFAILRAGSELSRGSRHTVPAPPGIPLQRIELDEIGGKRTAAWIAEAPGPKAIILVHGNGSDRNGLVRRVPFFLSLGYTVVLPDLNGHGETAGERKTFGVLEAKDVANAFAFLKKDREGKRGKTWIGGVGTSLGGASLLKAEADGVPFDALILESVFADIRAAARNRLRNELGAVGPGLEPLLTLQIPLWLGRGITRDSLRPVVWAESVRCPALILSGSRDTRALPSESQAIFAAIPSHTGPDGPNGPKKRFEVVEGAGHQDLWAFDSSAYAARVEGFLGRN